MKASVRRLAFFASMALVIPLALNALSYANFDFAYGFLRLKKEAVASGLYLPAYYAHVLPAAFVLVIGLVQLNTSWRNRWPDAHRFLGKIYVGAILLLSGPGGIVMSFFIGRGALVQLSFLVQSATWWLCTWAAYRSVMSGNIRAHREWMLRSYSITFAAVTLRVYAFAGSWIFDLSQPGIYATIAWASWMFNLIVCEWIIRRRFKHNSVLSP